MDIYADSLVITKTNKNDLGYNLKDLHIGEYAKIVIAGKFIFKLEDGVCLKHDHICLVNGYIRIKLYVNSKNIITKVVCTGADDICTVDYVNRQIEITRNRKVLLSYTAGDLTVLNHTSKIEIDTNDLDKQYYYNDYTRLPIKYKNIEIYQLVLASTWFKQKYIELLDLITSKKTVSVPAKCVICADNSPMYVMKDCMHLVYCLDCNMTESHTCPMCRKESTTVKIYY